MPKDFTAMRPREVEAYLREQVRRTFGDAVENNATIYARRGYYTVGLILPSERTIEFDNFRKADAPKIAKAIRALK